MEQRFNNPSYDHNRCLLHETTRDQFQSNNKMIKMFDSFYLSVLLVVSSFFSAESEDAYLSWT